MSLAWTYMLKESYKKTRGIENIILYQLGNVRNQYQLNNWIRRNQWLRFFDFRSELKFVDG